jgi:hypothetical protein
MKSVLLSSTAPRVPVQDPSNGHNNGHGTATLLGSGLNHRHHLTQDDGNGNGNGKALVDGNGTPVEVNGLPMEYVVDAYNKVAAKLGVDVLDDLLTMIERANRANSETKVAAK